MYCRSLVFDLSISAQLWHVASETQIHHTEQAGIDCSSASARVLKTTVIAREDPRLLPTPLPSHVFLFLSFRLPPSVALFVLTFGSTHVQAVPFRCEEPLDGMHGDRRVLAAETLQALGLRWGRSLVLRACDRQRVALISAAVTGPF